jgi:alpha 1,2-mannosyltransferase
VPKLQISACSFTTAQCRTIKKTWNLNSTYVFSPPDNRGTSDKHFPSKPAAIISATFAEILFLDTDSYLVRDPEYLFQYDPMYLQFGALFFPDALISGQLLTVWKLLNTTCNPNEFEVDSGALLINKKRVWNALYITKLMNDQYELFYKLVKKNFQ